MAVNFGTTDFGMKRDRWVEIRYQYVRDLVRKGFLDLLWKRKEEMHADLHTKMQDPVTFAKCIDMLPIEDFQPPS